MFPAAVVSLRLHNDSQAATMHKEETGLITVFPLLKISAIAKEESQQYFPRYLMRSSTFDFTDMNY